MLKKYREVLVECRQSVKEPTGEEWNLGELKGLSADDLCTWAMTYTTVYDGHAYLVMDKCVNFERDIWFELGKCTWINNPSIYQDHMKYIRNDIVKPFCVRILRYAERVREMNDLANYLPPNLMKGRKYEAANWKVCK